MNKLAKLFEPSKTRLMNNAFKMMMSAKDPEFKEYWTKVYVHLLKQYKMPNKNKGNTRLTYFQFML